MKREMLFNLRATQSTINENKNADKISLNIKVNSVKELFDVMREEQINYSNFHIFNVLEFKAENLKLNLMEVK